MAYDISKLTKLSALKELAEKLAAEQTARKALATKVDNLVAAGGEPNVIEGVSVNGTAATVTDKVAAITVPTKVSDLDNDSKFQSDSEVSAAIQAAIAATGHASFEVAESVPAAASAKENVLYLVMNSETGHYDIYALVSGEVVLLDDTTIDLTNYVTSEALAAAVAGLIKLTDISVAVTGTGNAVTAVTYDSATGVITVTKGTTFITEDDVATDAEVTEMLTEVFGE